MIEGYFDESGIHDGAPVCLVGGFYGTHIAWRKFEIQWNKVLSDYPELSNSGFHAKVFFARDKGNRVAEYAGWPDDRASKFLDRLVQCVLRNRVFPIGYAVMVKDFLALPLESRQWYTGAKFSKVDGKFESGGCPDKPYYLPFQFYVLKSAQISNANSNDKIHFFVGTDRSLHGYASALFDYVLTDDRLDEALRTRLGTVVNPPAKDTPGLQAADLLVYRMYRASKDKIANPQSEPSPLLMKLLRNWRGELTLRLMNSELFTAMEKAGREAYERMMKGSHLAL